MPAVCFERPFNVNFGKEGFVRNKMTGFIEQPIEGPEEAHVSIFVSKTDLTVEKVIDDPQKKEEQPQILYKHICNRNIQAILSLDNWMYTLSNTCPRLELSNKIDQQEKEKLAGMHSKHEDEEQI